MAAAQNAPASITSLWRKLGYPGKLSAVKALPKGIVAKLPDAPTDADIDAALVESGLAAGHDARLALYQSAPFKEAMERSCDRIPTGIGVTFTLRVQAWRGGFEVSFGGAEPRQV